MRLSLGDCCHLVIISPSENFMCTTHFLLPLLSKTFKSTVCRHSIEFIFYEHVVPSPISQKY